MRDRAHELLGPRGPFARALEGYEHRESQLTMARAVERALEDATILVCEAATGTGKTLAYLLPAVLSGQRVVISTATKALEDQIFDKDLPVIERVLGERPAVALVKGLGNYVCRRRLEDLRRSPPQDLEGRRKLALVDAWVRETDAGDFGELRAWREGDPFLAEFSSGSETRVGSSCEHFDACFVTRMKRASEAAQVVVVNHHLFFADLALKIAAPDARASVLGRFDAVIFDEAQRLEEVATDFFGVRVSSARVEAMLRDAERSFRARGLADALFGQSDGGALVRDVRATSEAFFARATTAARDEGAGGHAAALDADAFHGPLEDAWLAFDTALEGLAGFAETRGGHESIDLARRRAEKLRSDLARIAEGPRAKAVIWVERGASTSIGASFIDVSALLREHVFKKFGGVVLTSATLTSTELARPTDAASGPSRRSFAFIRSRLGLDDLDVPIEELELASPFDHASTTLLYLPTDLPDVTTDTFSASAAARTSELVDASGGGAFVLTTSTRSMRAIADGLRRSGREVWVQGELPKAELLARFRSHGDAVLVATMSFWEGVDVPGRALRLVVIDRIPFAVPTDPIVRARSDALAERGLNPFANYMVPEAAITLKQGFGRLIRTSTDRGVVAILDRRITQKGYGSKILATLPETRRTTELDEVRAFFSPA